MKNIESVIGYSKNPVEELESNLKVTTVIIPDGEGARLETSSIGLSIPSNSKILIIPMDSDE